MITMGLVAVVPTEWAINCLASSIRYRNNASPYFGFKHEDVDRFEIAAPGFKQALVDAADEMLPVRLPSDFQDGQKEFVTWWVTGKIAEQAFQSLDPERQAAITELVMADVED